MRPDLPRLADVRFVLAVAVLALNDHLLKHAWPCWFTGKLSDVAGLFAFGWFWVAMVPHRRDSVLIAIAVLFAWWKSPLSQPALDGWNGMGLWTMGRVVDATDLLALPVLLLLRCASLPCVVPGRAVRFLTGVFALFVFGATSMPRGMLMPMDVTTLHYEDVDYKLRTTEAELWRVLGALDEVQPLDTTRISTVGSPAKHYCLNNVKLREVGAHSVRFSYYPLRAKLRFHLIAIDPDHPIRVFSSEELDAHRDLYRRLFEQAVLKAVSPSSVPRGGPVYYWPEE
ncbi:MAG: hypothetical protein IPJ76_18560 [Flavobacteriales bacterium]|nr:MAG: hypothetical protein IPJ76_18560 [Flavobacteriales bacterium]